MTRPTTPPGWGSGIPGIPSIWETPGAQQATPQATPPHARLRRRPVPPARPWVLGSLALTALLLLSGLMGAGGDLTDDSTGVAIGPDFAIPGPGPARPPPPPVPGPIAAPVPGPALVATRADGSGDPFALPLGQPALLRDAAAGTASQVRPGAALRQAGALVVDVQVIAASGAGAIVATGLDVPVLRLPDGRELQAEVRGADGSGFPTTLAPGQRWDGVLVFTDPGQGGALVLLHLGRALASWTIPAG